MVTGVAKAAAKLGGRGVRAICGIVALASVKKRASDFLFEGLKRLEYRGYDSWGLTTYDGHGMHHTHRALGKVSKAELIPLPGMVGIGHTRWSSHGTVSLTNTHPIEGGTSTSVWVVHNGIIENHRAIRELLKEKGYVFKTDTDTEALAHLLASMMPPGNPGPTDVAQAISSACSCLQGNYAFALLTRWCYGTVFLARRDTPLIIGENGHAASDPAALAGHDSWRQLQEHEVGVLRDGQSFVYSMRKLFRVEGLATLWETPRSEKPPGESPHMLDEIYDQAGCVHSWGASPFTVPSNVRRAVLFGCGSSYYAALLGRYYLEAAGIQTRVEYATELCYRPLFDTPDTLYVGITQSGETRDTLRGLQHLVHQVGKERVRVLTNVPHSTAARLVEPILMGCGHEIGVAATKTFLASCLKLVMGVVVPPDMEAAIRGVLEGPFSKPDIHVYVTAKQALLFANGPLFPIACEAALKLKEVAQVHAEAILSSEVKHGPIALIDDETQSVFLLDGRAHDAHRVLSNMEEVAARGGNVLCITNEASALMAKDVADHVLTVPTIREDFQPLVILVALQLLAYHTAVHYGLNVDYPRSLAKCVTV